MRQLFQQRIELGHRNRLARVTNQPVAKLLIQGAAALFRHEPRLLDQLFVRTQRDVLHTETVYTKTVFYGTGLAIASS